MGADQPRTGQGETGGRQKRVAPPGVNRGEKDMDWGLVGQQAKIAWDF